MITFELRCEPGGHQFEGWFRSSQDYADQLGRGLVICPQCGSDAVGKAPMAPAVGRKANSMTAPAKREGQPVTNSGPSIPPEVATFLSQLAEVQSKALETSKWVGGDFADASRAMHYGEREVESIHGRATADEARELHDEGIAVAPLIVPFVPPDEVN